MTEIKLDLDTAHSHQGLLRLARSRNWEQVFMEGHPGFGKLRVQSVQVSRTSPGHYHVLIAVSNEIPPEYLTFLQLALGSDVAREMLNRRRILTCPEQEHWNLFFPMKLNARGQVISQEKLDMRLSKQVRDIIRQHQRVKK